MINCNFESNSLLDYRDDDSVCGCHLKKKNHYQTGIKRTLNQMLYCVQFKNALLRKKTRPLFFLSSIDLIWPQTTWSGALPAFSTVLQNTREKINTRTAVRSVFVRVNQRHIAEYRQINSPVLIIHADAASKSVDVCFVSLMHNRIGPHQLVGRWLFMLSCINVSV